MWAHVHERFAKDGVTNVVWTLNYMNYSKWDCMEGDMYPGDQYVDWILWEDYVDNGNFSASNAHFYDVLKSTYSTKADANGITHNYWSHPLGNGEAGATGSNESVVVGEYNEMKSDLDNNAQGLKMRAYFDAAGTGNTSATPGTTMTGCNEWIPKCSPLYQSQQDSFNKFADDSKFK
jgi:hypothetical protein